MTTFGLTDQGFIPEPLSSINADIIAAFQDSFGADIDTSANGPFGIFAGIMADREAPIQQLMQAVYNAAYPDTASGSQLDDVASLTGVIRLPPTKSVAGVVWFGTDGTTIPDVSIAATSGNVVQFQTSGAAHLQPVSAYSAGLTYEVGALATGLDGGIYVCSIRIVNSTIAPNFGLNTPDDTGFWVWCSDSSSDGAVYLLCTATQTGPLTAPSGSINLVATPISGINGVINPLDATVGGNIETDASLRLRRIQLLQLQGSSPVASIRAALLNTLGVTNASVYENPLDVADGNGRPPHSVECVVSGGTALAVATTIFNSKGAGINTTGSLGQNITDPATGQVYPISFTRPTSIPIYVVINLKKGAAWPSNGVVLTQAAVTAYAAGQVPEISSAAFVAGQTVYAGPISAAVFDQLAPGQIADITSVFIGTSPGPGTNTPIAMLYSQTAAFDTSRVTVNAT